MGEQGVASMNASDALQYNPANLIFNDGMSLSYFRNPWNLFDRGIPLTSANAAVPIGKRRKRGGGYTDWDLGEGIVTTELNPAAGQLYHWYERSLAVGYAMPLSNEFALGGQVRYVWQSYPMVDNIDHVLFSLGANYRPASFFNRFNLGLSFMNFGTPVEYRGFIINGGGESTVFLSSGTPPAQINFGMNAVAIKNIFADLDLMAGVKKPLQKQDGSLNDNGESSFAALTSDWNDFPNDMTVQVGLNYSWHPIYLGAGISYFQEMYVGYFSTGPDDGTNSFYTHGCTIGVESYGVKATVGYAGRWHNNNASSYVNWDLPWETFQFGLSTDFSAFEKRSDEATVHESPKNIIVSGGYSYGYSVGQMKSISIEGNNLSFTSNSNWTIESDFYINENGAILSSFTYSRMTANLSAGPPYFPFFILPFVMETMSLESGFRYHPICDFHPLFIQASLGVIRLNPVLENTDPRYSYKSFDRVAAGVLIPLKDLDIEVIPKVGLRTIFMESPFNGNELIGYNQVELGLSAGYNF